MRTRLLSTYFVVHVCSVRTVLTFPTNLSAFRLEADWASTEFASGNIRTAAMRSLAVITESGRTSELTRRREFNQASPDESSCETRSRRSRPTICYVSPLVKRQCCLDGFVGL